MRLSDYVKIWCKPIAEHRCSDCFFWYICWYAIRACWFVGFHFINNRYDFFLLVAGFRKSELSAVLETIILISISVDNLAIYIICNCYKVDLKCFSHNFRIRSSFIFYVYGFDLFMIIWLFFISLFFDLLFFLKADNRFNPIPSFYRVDFMFFKISFLGIWLINSCEFVNSVFVNFKVL